ncbi:PPE domain-containing protein [Nocardia flavorosea]|uniref:PPE domain-containing protein n=2 Tax=Nocardia flavorosea TaxID=53429 RepID=A0A846YCV6_9NOCA|nr:PPE domain-containing protein [Nocardia flavorosea]
MIEPPRPGFTGVVWPARPADRLARELTTGAGSVPMAEAVQAWTRLAASIGAAVVEYDKAVVEIRGAWGSGRSSEVLQRISALRDWLVEAAGAAAANAARFQAQVAAYEVARLAMPHTADIEQIQQVQRMLESVGGMVGAPIKAVAAETDKDSDVAKAVASRVMENYEKATEPLALPWQQTTPPVVAPETALAAEHAAAPAPAPRVRGGVSLGSMGIGAVPIPGAVPRVPTAYSAPLYAQSATTPETTPQTTPVPSAGASSQAAPLAPGSPAGAGGAAPDTSRFPRAGLPGDESDHLGAENELRAAPAVLGGVEPVAPAPESRAGGTS